MKDQVGGGGKINEQDKKLLSPDYPYPTCATVRSMIPGCTDVLVGTVKNIGEVEAECIAIETGTTSHYEWIFTPCSCFPNRVPLEYEAER